MIINDDDVQSKQVCKKCVFQINRDGEKQREILRKRPSLQLVRIFRNFFREELFQNGHLFPIWNPARN